MMTLQEIAQLIDGVVLGNSQLEITGLATINCARPDELTFAKDQKICQSLENSDAGAAIVPHGIEPISKPCIQVEDVVASSDVMTATIPLLDRSLSQLLASSPEPREAPGAPGSSCVRGPRGSSR